MGTTKVIQDLADTVIKLSSKDRIFLAERLLQSLDDADLEKAWLAEAQKRVEEVRTGKVKPIPAKEVYARIENLLKR